MKTPPGFHWCGRCVREVRIFYRRWIPAAGRSDDHQLTWAAANGRTLYSFNRGDFYRLHTVWLREGRSHSGIILSKQDLAVGEQMRRLLRLINRVPSEEMQNRIEFLSNWKV